MIGKNWTRDNIIWLAGLLEGEGCFSNGAIVLRMTDYDVVEKAFSIAGFGKIYVGGEKKKPHHKQCWHWQARKGKFVYALLIAILPFMGDRRSRKITENIKNWISCQHGRIQHGTAKKYFRYHCRCDLCRNARNLYDQGNIEYSDVTKLDDTRQ